MLFYAILLCNLNLTNACTAGQGILVETLPMPYRDEIKGLSKASGLNLGKLSSWLKLLFFRHAVISSD